MQGIPLVRKNLPNLAEHLYLVTNLHIGFTSQLVTVWGCTGFVCASMHNRLQLANKELSCSDLNWGNPAVLLWNWCWDALSFLLLSSSQRNLSSRMMLLQHCRVLRGQALPGILPSEKARCGGKGNVKALLSSVRTRGLAFRAVSSSVTGLACLWREFRLGFSPCRWGDCVALIWGGHSEFSWHLWRYFTSIELLLPGEEKWLWNWGESDMKKTTFSGLFHP